MRDPRIQHAPNVNEIARTLIGAIVWPADHGSVEIGTRLSMGGNLHEANMCWFALNGNSYALVYRGGNVYLCDRNRAGNVIASFNNANWATIRTGVRTAVKRTTSPLLDREVCLGHFEQ